MSHVVTLPSGAKMPLQAPTVAGLLAYGKVTEAALLYECFAHPDMAAGSLTDEDRTAVAEWALFMLKDDPELGDLVRVCLTYHEAPSRRLGVADPVLALRFDAALTPKPQQEREQMHADKRRHKVSFSVLP